MKKMPMLFKMEFPAGKARGGRKVVDEFNPDALDVLAGDGPVTATVKYDGTCMFLDIGGTWYARRAVKPGKPTPEGFILEDRDANTGIDFGWIPVEDSPFAKPAREAIAALGDDPASATYELIGPKINGNPEGVDTHVLVRHGVNPLAADEFPTIDQILRLDARDARVMLAPFFADFKARGVEGVVWWAGGKPVAKLRVKDFADFIR